MLGHTREILLSAALSVVSDLATPHPSFMKSETGAWGLILKIKQVSRSRRNFTDQSKLSFMFWIASAHCTFKVISLFCLHHQIVHREDRLAVEISVWVVNIDMGSNSHMTVPVEFR
ncbi:hypothetical protein C8J57DRAFT_1220422 [Mycena rebaudengoi]|nr:hypothetical protein C8J57DRAFT_1220422 [Mycena rebaudengoi]